MARIGFKEEPDFEAITIDLDFDQRYAGYIKYKAEIRRGRTKIDPSVYVPMDLLPSEGYPSRLRVTLNLPPNVKWRKWG